MYKTTTEFDVVTVANLDHCFSKLIRVLLLFYVVFLVFTNTKHIKIYNMHTVILVQKQPINRIQNKFTIKNK